MGLTIEARYHHDPADPRDEDVMQYYFWGGEWADREFGAFQGPHTSEDGPSASMSYYGYVEFRRALGATYLGIETPEGGTPATPKDDSDPLWKMLCYADNEGVFGPPMVKRVAARLSALDPAMLAIPWHREALAQWVIVFAAAAEYEDGCVEWG